jgi:hypothetical protein
MQRVRTSSYRRLGTTIGPIFKEIPTFRDNYRSYLQGNTNVSGQLSVPSSRKSLPIFRENYRSYLQENTDVLGQLSVPSSRKYRRFGTTIGPIFKKFLTDISRQLSVLPSRVLEDGTTDNLSRKSVSNFHYTLPKNSEERRYRKQPCLDDRRYANHLLCRRPQYVNHLA